MLWEHFSTQLLNNYFSVLAHFKFLERRLIKDSELKANYAKNIEEDLEKGM